MFHVINFRNLLREDLGLAEKNLREKRIAAQRPTPVSQK